MAVVVQSWGSALPLSLLFLFHSPPSAPDEVRPGNALQKPPLASPGSHLCLSGEGFWSGLVFSVFIRGLRDLSHEGREPVIPGKLLHGRWEGALPHSPGPSWQLGWGGARCGPWERGPQRGVGREAPLLPLMEFLFPRWGEGMKGGVDSPGWKDACLPASGLACLSARTPGPTLLTALALTDPFCPAFSAASSRKTALLPLDLR